jgi:DNA-binding IclR family transcriptional regulator
MKYSLLTLKKGLATLELVAESVGDIGVTELSKQLGEPVTVVYRILRTLSELGYINQDPKTKRYRFGLRIWELSEKSIARLGIVKAAQPFLARLVQATGETSALAIAHGTDFLYVASIDGFRPLRAYVPPGSRTPLAYPTASGRVLAAHIRPEIVDEIFAEGVKRFTPSTVHDPKQIRSILQEVREKRFAIVHGEYQHELSAIAAPVFNSVGDCIAALSISGVKQHFQGESSARLIETVKSEAEALSDWLRGATALAPVPARAAPAA